MKKVSVIVPMYKAKNYVKPCVDSLMRQGLDDCMEILLIDDRSPDDTYEYAKNMFQDHPCVRVIEQEVNGGPGKARNTGLREAVGDYVCFADVDDLYVDGAIAQMLSVAEQEEADVVHMNGVYLTVANPLPDDLSELEEDHLLKFIFTDDERDINDTTAYSTADMEKRLAAWYSHNCHWSVWGKLYRKEFLDKNNIRFLDMKIGEDCLFVMKCVVTADKYVQKNDIAYIYRMGEAESVSRGKGNPKVFISAQRAIFEAEKNFVHEFEGIPYLDEHPEELLKLKNMEIAEIESLYAVAKYQEIGRENLSRNKDVIAIFEEYFEKQAVKKMQEVFDKYDTLPTQRSGDVFSSYDFWKSIKNVVGNNRTSLRGVRAIVNAGSYEKR